MFGLDASYVGNYFLINFHSVCPKNSLDPPLTEEIFVLIDVGIFFNYNVLFEKKTKVLQNCKKKTIDLFMYR